MTPIPDGEWILHPGYSLKLANGRAWRFIADRNSEWLCEELVRLAGLNTASPGPCETVALVSGGIEQPLADVLDKARKLPGAITLPEDGWVSNNHRFLKFWNRPGTPFAIGATSDRRDRKTDVTQVRQTLYPVVAGEIATGGMSVHGALVEREGAGVLIAAKGGTGKSTCCRRIPLPWRVLCDDEALVVNTGNDTYRAHPFPTWSEHMWGPSERSWQAERHVRIAAIFFLEKADTDEVIPYPQGMAAVSLYISGIEAFEKYKVFMSTAQVAEFSARILDNSCRIARTIPAYVLKATLTGRFWEAIDRELNLPDATLYGPELNGQPSSTPSVKPKRLNI